MIQELDLCGSLVIHGDPALERRDPSDPWKRIVTGRSDPTVIGGNYGGHVTQARGS